MNPLWKIALFALAVVVTAAVLAPPFYWLALAGAERGIFPALAEFPFHRFFSRIAQIAALVYLWPFARWVKIRTLSEIGIEKNPSAGRDLVAGLAFALIPLAGLAALYFAMEIYRVRDGIEWAKLGRIFATAAFVSAFEEFLFRGVLLGLAVRALGRWAGLAGVTAVFAAVHFVKPRAAFAPEDVGWLSGFALLGSAFDAEGGPAVLVSGMATLVVVGWILGQSALWTRSLWLPVGLHAGWILGQQTIGLIGRFRVRPPDAWLPWVGPNVVSGMVPTGLLPMVPLLVTGLLACWYVWRARGVRRLD